MYGDEWENDWAKKMGNDVITWGPDAELTPKGREEALVHLPNPRCSLVTVTDLFTRKQTIQKGWKKNLDAGAPLPNRWLLSPMTRAADTMALSWGPYLHDETPLFVEVSTRL